MIYPNINGSLQFDLTCIRHASDVYVFVHTHIPEVKYELHNME